MTKTAIDADDSVVKGYLKKPYMRLLIPEDDGTFRGEILEFPGCIATGDTREEVMSALEDVAASWLASALSSAQSIPEPIDSSEYSGRIVARFPRSLHKKASLVAERDGVSLNQLIVASVAQYVGERSIQSKPTSISVNAVHLTFSNVTTGWATGINLINPGTQFQITGGFLPLTDRKIAEV